MKHSQKIRGVLSIFLFLTATLFFSCNKDEKPTPEIFSDQITQVTMDAISFIDKWIVFETTIYKPDNLSIEEAREIMDEYFVAGEAFANSLGKLLYLSGTKDLGFVGQKNDDDALSCVMSVVGAFDISGLSPDLAIKIGNIIKDTKDARKAIDDAHNRGDLDDLEYWEAISAIPHLHNMNLANITGSAIFGAGAAGLTGYAIAQSAGGTALAFGTYGLGVTVGAPLVVGGAVAYGTYRLFSWYTSTDKSGVETTHLVSFPWEFEKPIPAFLFNENSKVAISMNNYAPILIENLVLPADDYNIRIEFEAIPFSELGTNKSGSKNSLSEVCFYKDPVQPGGACNNVLFVMGQPSPANPAPHQGVTVTATLMPVTPGCDIHFSIVGTDGYTNSATYSSNQNGQASFYIPGAQPGVFDKVSITTSSGASHTVSYYFGGSAKGFDPDAVSPRISK